MLLRNPQPHRLGKGAQLFSLLVHSGCLIEREIRRPASPDQLGFFRLRGIRKVGNLDKTGSAGLLGCFKPSIFPFPIKIIGFWRRPGKALEFLSVNGSILPLNRNPTVFVGNFLRFLLQLRQLFSFTFDYPDV